MHPAKQGKHTPGGGTIKKDMNADENNLNYWFIEKIIVLHGKIKTVT